jgi:hypothetical protein
MAIPELPFWSIKHNWAQPVTERLEWLTDVLASQSGAEQRRCLRLSPRRFMEYTINPTRGERTMTDLMLRKLFSNQWLVPLWHDKAKMTAAAAMGANRLVFDNRWREFVTGGYAVIFKDAFTFEIVEIEDQDDTGIDLAEVTSAAWPKGSPVYPIRVGWMSDQANTLGAITGTVGEAVVGFMIPGGNDYDAGAETFPLYLGKPVLTLPPNRVESITAQLERMTADRDGQLGLIYRGDEAGRSFGNQSYSWIVTGRQARHEFRQLLYRLQGRQNAMWLPTFNDDLFVAVAAPGGTVTLSVEQAGLGYVGAPFASREHILVNGEGRKVNALAAPLAGNERIVLNAGITGAVKVGQSLSWMDVGRLDQDTVEITHHTDSDGTLECAAVLKSFSDTRTTGGAIYVPIPNAVEGGDPCGVPEDVNPCAPHYCPPSSVFHWELAFNGCNPAYCPTRNWYQPRLDNGDPTRPLTVNLPITIDGITGPEGQSLYANVGVLNFCNGSVNRVYEHNYYNEPDSGWYHDPRAIHLQGQLLQEWTATNNNFTMSIFGRTATGSGGLQIQYGAFWCGDHVAIGTLTRTDTSPPDCVPTPVVLIDQAGLVGNAPYSWGW